MTDQAKTKTIRDFIYVDQGRLYSFYSQLNEGIAQQIFQSFLNSESATNTQTSPDVEDEVIESQRSRALQRTESTILYDFMYEQLERKLGNVIIDVSEIIEGESAKEVPEEGIRLYLDTLRSAVMVKVVGEAAIEDYDRMDSFVGHINNVMEVLAFFHTLSDEAKAQLARLTEELNTEKDRNRRAQIKEQIKRLNNPKLHAEDMNLLDNPNLVEGLRVILKAFYDKKFEIAISSGGPMYTTFRAIIDREWLRVRPEILRSLYAGTIESPWTMVGQITSLPFPNITNLDPLNTGLTEKLAESKSIRDPLRILFNRLRAFDAMLDQSSFRWEPIVCPLAIYRELKVQ